MRTTLASLPLILLCLLAAFLAAGCGDTPGPEALAALFPRQGLPGRLVAADSTQSWRESELEAHPGGDARLFREYGCREAATLEYLAAGQVSLVVNLYRMIGSEAAYGLFSHNRGLEYAPVELGTAGARSELQLIFCRGPFYAEVQSLAMDMSHPRAQEELARRLEERLRDAGGDGLPELLELLPQPGLDPHSRLLVLGPLALESRLPLGGGNPYRLGPEAPGVLGLYRLQEGASLSEVLVVRYPSVAEAAPALEGLAEFFQGRGTRSSGRRRMPWRCKGRGA